MKRSEYRIVISLLVCCFLTGCYPQVIDLAPQAPDRPWKIDHTDDIDEEMSSAQKFELPPHPIPPYENADVCVEVNHVYTLPELIDLAQHANPDTRIAWEQAKQAAFAVGLTLANYVPQISADVLIGQQNTPLPVPKAMSPKGHIIVDTSEVLPSLVIKWLLFDFGKRDCAVESAKQLSYASNVAFTQVHQQLIFNVSKAYFNLNASRAQLRAKEDAVKNTEILQNSAESKHERGLEKTTEVAIAVRETAKVRYELEKARSDDHDAYYDLLGAMGLNPTLNIQIADSTGRSFPRELAQDVNLYISQALEQRPDIIEAFAKLRASDADICSAEADYYPTINLDGFVYRGIGWLRVVGQGPTTMVNKPAAAFFMQLKFPLYDGGTRRNNLEIARSKNAAAQEELRKTQEEAIRQVARAYDMVKSTLAEYDSALALVKAADVAFDAAIDSYRQGVGTFTDAVSTNTEKANAESELANAYAAVLTAAAALAFTTGELTSSDALYNLPQCK